MLLVVKEIASGTVHEIFQFTNLESGETIVLCDTWPGRHQINFDCCWLRITEQDWYRIKFIRENPELTLKQLSKELKMNYTTIFQFARRHNLTVTRERGERNKTAFLVQRHFKKNK